MKGQNQNDKYCIYGKQLICYQIKTDPNMNKNKNTRDLRNVKKQDKLKAELEKLI